MTDIDEQISDSEPSADRLNILNLIAASVFIVGQIPLVMLAVQYFKYSGPWWIGLPLMIIMIGCLCGAARFFKIWWREDDQQ